MNKTNELIKRIVVDPKIMTGKPVIKGTRITVEHILSLLTEGATIHEILLDYTHLKQEDIFACMLSVI